MTTGALNTINFGGGGIQYNQSLADSISRSTSNQSSGSSNSSASGIEQWYQDYEKDLLALAQAQAGQGYNPYGGERTAGFNADQLHAMQMIREAADNPAYQQYIDQWVGQMGQAPGMMGEAANLIRQGSTYDPSKFDQIYSHQYQPTVDAMMAEANRIGQQDFEDTTLASLNRNFTGSGGWGGSRNQILGADAAALAQAEIEGKKAGIEMQGKTTASQDYLNWARQNTSAGQALGGAASGILSGAKTALDYGLGVQGAIGSDASALANVGKQQQDLTQRGLDVSYADFLKEQAFPWEQINSYRDVLKATPAPNWSSGGGSSWSNGSSMSDSTSSNQSYGVGLNFPSGSYVSGDAAMAAMQGGIGGLGLMQGLTGTNSTGTNPANISINRDQALAAQLGYNF